MKKLAIASILLIVACGDNVSTSPDAAVFVDSVLVDSPIDPCCALLPDDGALRVCAGQGLPPHVCGVYVCHVVDGGVLTFNFCSPGLDGGM